MSKKIVIDSRFWSETGIGRYIRNLVYELQKLDKENDYFLLLLKKDYPKIELNRNFKKVLADFPWYGLKEQVKLPGILKKIEPDLVHFPHFNVPISYKGKYIVTIHDLIHQHFETRRATTHNPLIYKIKRLGYKRTFSHAIKKSIKVITPSDFVKEQLIKEWNVDKDKIIVTHEGVEQSTINLAHQNKAGDFQKVSLKFKLSKPYIFYIGNAHPHKNIPALIEAFGTLKEKYPNHSLVLSGPDHYFWQQMKKTKSLENVIFTGFVTEREMVTLYKNAESFVTSSQEEGFGIPILEAMSCGCPVVCSGVASLPEVGGNAALYFDSKNIEDIVEKLDYILKDSKLRKELIKKGLKRYKEFSWKELAKQTLQIYQKVV